MKKLLIAAAALFASSPPSFAVECHECEHACMGYCSSYQNSAERIGCMHHCVAGCAHAACP